MKIVFLYQRKNLPNRDLYSRPSHYYVPLYHPLLKHIIFLREARVVLGATGVVVSILPVTLGGTQVLLHYPGQYFNHPLHIFAGL